MSKFLDAAVSPGITGAGSGGTTTRHRVYQLASGVALGSTVFPAIDPGVGGSLTDAAWLNFTCDNGAGVSVPFYIIASEGVAAPDPDPVAHTGLNPTQMCIFVDAPKEWHRRFTRDMRFNAIQNSGAVAYLRVEMTSELNV